jgi:hypothetical protein
MSLSKPQGRHAVSSSATPPRPPLRTHAPAGTEVDELDRASRALSSVADTLRAVAANDPSLHRV